ncbi:MAG: hypothetical protein AB2A00_19460 [Myxococcota bacterium]
MQWRDLLPRPLWAPLVVALVLRLVAALSSAGFYAMDCYFHVLHPAWQWLHDPNAPMPSDFRSAFLPLLLHGVMRLARALGAPDGTAMAHAAFLAMAAWSMLAVPLTWHLARARLGERAATTAAWLTAAQFLMPHIGSRTLVEAAAAPPLLACLLLLERVRAGRGRPLFTSWACGVMLGLAGLFRMHVGVVLPVVMVLLWLTGGDARRRVGLQLALMAGGGCMVLVQGCVDLATQGGFLVVPFRYYAYQRAFVDSYGVAPFYTFLVLFLGLTVPPLVLGYWRGVLDAARAHPAVTWSLVVFVGAHSTVGHKEERFMFTVLPLFFILLGAGLARAWEGAAWQRWCVRAFVAVNTVLLIPYTVAFPRRNSIDPLRDASVMEPRPAVYGAAVRLPGMYLGWGGRVVENAGTEEMMTSLRGETGNVVRLVVSRAQPAPDVERLREMGWSCGEPREYPSDVMDRVLVMMNPENNRSRMPSTAWDCTRGGGT